MTASTSPAQAAGAPPPAPARAPRSTDEGLTVAALLDLLDEPSSGAAAPPSLGTRLLSLATAAAPRIATGVRRLATAAGVATLLVLVPLTAVVAVTAERAGRAVAGWDLPGRARALIRTVAAADLPGRARLWSRRARVWAGPPESWPHRAAQWALGPRGSWTAATLRPLATGRRMRG